MRSHCSLESEVIEGISRHSKIAVCLLSALLFCFASSRPAEAQVTTAVLLGNVTDTSGAAVAGAQVTATSADTGSSRTVPTNKDGEYRIGPDGDTEIGLHTSRFEVLRWRTGRRSRAQLAAMDWSADPAPVLEHLYLFGPADADIIE